MATIDVHSRCVLYEQLYEALEKTIQSLVKEVTLPNGQVLYHPHIMVTVLLQGAAPSNFKVMLHGVSVTASNLKSILSDVYMKLKYAENEFSQFTAKRGTSLYSGLGSGLKNAMFGIKLLPHDACPLIIHVTDCVATLEDEYYFYDGLIMLMNREDITCSAIELGSVYSPGCTYGYIPNSVLVRHLTQCTFGEYFHFDELEDQTLDTFADTMFQSRMLFRDNVGHERFYPQDDIEAPNEHEDFLYSKQTVLEGIHYLYLLETRYREGFHVEDVYTRVDSGHVIVHIRLVLFWRMDSKIHYTLEFIHHHETPNPSPHINIKMDAFIRYGKFNNSKELLEAFLSNISRTDSMLSRIVENMIHLNRLKTLGDMGTSKQQIEKLFWMALLQLDKDTWHRWFRIERIEIILRPDEDMKSDVVEFKRKILDESKSSRNVRFSFKVSKKEILAFFNHWSSLSSSKHSYAKILDINKSIVVEDVHENEVLWVVPEFVVVRLTIEERKYGGVCIVTLSYFDVSPTERFKISEYIKSSLLNMTSSDNVSYLTLCHKPLRYIRITYNFDQLKKYISQLNIKKPESMDHDVSLDHPIIVALSQFSPMNGLLSRHMRNKRWIWNIQSQHTQDAALEAIIKTRVRDGFKLTDREKFYSFYKEIPIACSEKEDYVYCAIQYVVYSCYGFLVTEIWTEAQDGWIFDEESTGKKYSDVFSSLKDLIYEIDFRIISTLVTFDILASLLNPLTNRERIKYLSTSHSYRIENTLLEEVSLEIPPFDLLDVSKRGAKQREYFRPFKSNDNSRLHNILADIIASRSECEIPNEGELCLEEKGKCWVKSLGNTNEFLLIQLCSLETEEGDSYYAENYSGFYPSKAPSPMCINIYQCTREVEPVHSPTMALRKILDPQYVEPPILSTPESKYPPITQFCEFIRNDYRREYGKAVYNNLRDGLRISEEDFKAAIETFQEYSVEVDITQFFRILFKWKEESKDQEDIDVHDDCLSTMNVNEDFAKTYEHFFQRVLMDGDHHYYFLNPTFIKNSTSEEDEDEDDSSMFTNDSRDFLQEVREENKHLVHEILSKPLFMKVECIFLTKQDNDSPLSSDSSASKVDAKVLPVWTIPSPQTNPELSGITFFKVLLRFTYLTFPNSIMSPSVSPFDRYNSPKTIMDFINSPVRTVSETIPDPFKNIVEMFIKSVNATVSLQILELLRLRPQISMPIMLLALYHINQLSPPYTYEFYVPLVFVSEKQGLNIYKEELEATRDLTYASPDKNRYILTHIGEDSSGFLPFWLVIDVHKDKAEVIFQSKSMSREKRDELIMTVKTRLKKLCERANRISLLMQLNETRVCSVLLESGKTQPIAGGSDHEMKSESPYHETIESNERTLSHPVVFRPDQYACPSVAEIHIPFHERLETIQALKVAASSLMHFSVSNRPFMYVYMDEKGYIYYMKLSQPTVDEGIKFSTNPEYSSGRYLILSVHGVDCPREEILVQLRSLIETKLMDFTVKLFSSLLRRNPLMRLSDNDMQFLCPPTQVATVYRFQIPNYIHYIDAYKNVIENKLILQNFILLNTPQQIQDLDSSSDSSSMEMSDIKVSSKLFLYNQLAPELHPIKSFIDFGNGLACVLTDIHGRNKELRDLPKDIIAQGFEKISPVEWNQETQQQSSTTSSYVEMKIWTRGSIKIDKLLIYITNVVNQSYMDYLLEHYAAPAMEAILPNAMKETSLSNIYKLLGKSLELDTQSVKLFTSSFNLPSYALHNFFTDLHEILVDICGDLTPRIFTTQQENGIVYHHETVVSQGSLFKRHQYSNHDVDFAVLISKPRYSKEASNLSLISMSSEDDPISIETGNEIKKSRVGHKNENPLTQSFGLMKITQSELKVFTFNWMRENNDGLHVMLTRLLNWIHLRQHLLSNILHQKMGLFYHTPLNVEEVTVKHKTSSNVIKNTRDEPIIRQESKKNIPTPNNNVNFSFENIDLLSEYTSPSRSKTKRKNRNKKNLMSQKIGDVDISLLLKNLLPCVAITHKDDPVQRHAEHFKHIANKYIRKNASYNSIYYVYTQWYKPTVKKENLGVTMNDISSVMRSSRLFHCSRVPFYLPELYKKEDIIDLIPTDSKIYQGVTPDLKDMAVPDGGITLKDVTAKIMERPEQRLRLDELSMSQNMEQSKQKWKAKRLAQFFEEYTKYLESFGVNRVVFKPHTVKGSKKKTIPHLNPNYRYLQKVFRGGLLFFEIGCKDYFITCNFYCMFFNLDARGLSDSESSSSKMNKQFLYFTRECGKLKSQLHLGSFLYDFHIRQVASQFENMSKQNFAGDELVNMLQALCLYYERPPIHSRNIIATSHVNAHTGDSNLSPLELFTFIGNNASKYNFSTTAEKGITPGVYLLSSSNQLHMQGKEKMNGSSEDIYCVVAFISENLEYKKNSLFNLAYMKAKGHRIDMNRVPMEEGENAFQIAYFVLRSNKNSMFPLSRTHLPNEHGYPRSIDTTISNAGEKLLYATTLAISHSERDILWNKLTHLNETPLTEEQFKFLFSTVRRDPIQQIDDQLQELSSTKVNWNLFINYVASAPELKHFIITTGTLKHLLILNPMDHDYLVQFILEERKPIKIYSVKRDMYGSTPEKEIIEKRHISKVINTLCYWLWKLMINQMKK